MRLRVLPLLTVGVQHPYYAEPCEDFEFVTPASTQALLRSGRLLARVVAGRLHLLYEAAEGSAPVSSLAGRTLCFGLRLVNPFFDNVTAPVAFVGGPTPVFRNTADPRALDAPIGTTLTSGIHLHKARTADRPLSARLVNAAGAQVQAETLGAGVADCRFDLRSLEDGDYKIAEFFEDLPRTETRLHVSGELRGVGVWGLVAITVAEQFYGSGADFTIPFTVREEPLTYFVVNRNLKDTELNQLHITDLGASEDNRPVVAFAQVDAAAIDAPDIKATLLGDPSKRVAVFQSTTPQKRRENGFVKLQLNRNVKSLIENLPSPGADRPRAQMIVHVVHPA